MADSIDEGKRENLTFDGTLSSDIRSLITLIACPSIIPLFFQRLKMYYAVPRYKLCMGSMINIRIALKYGNCSRHEYRQPTSDSLRPLAVLLEHIRVWSTSVLCLSN